MTTIQQVGPDLLIPNGIAWTQSIAAARAKGGPVTDLLVNFAAALYDNDCIWFPQYCQRVTIDGKGVDGKRAHLKNSMAHGMPRVASVPFNGSANDKGMIVALMADDITIRSFEVEGAKTSSGSNNGAGIRLLKGTNLAVEDSFLHGNQGGMLLTTEDDPTTQADERGTVAIRRTRFLRNGAGGQAHHIYIDDGKLLTVEDSTFEEAINEANCIKTRTDETVITGTSIIQLAGRNSYELDAMGGKITLSNGKIVKRSPFSSQPKHSVHIYYEPKSKPMVLDFQDMEFDLRDAVAGKPIVLDTRIKHEGDGGIGADGLHHKKGENYYVPGEYGPVPEGKIDRCTFYVSKDLKRSFGFDGKGGRTPIFLVNDPNMPAGMLSKIEIGPDIRWVEV